MGFSGSQGFVFLAFFLTVETYLQTSMADPRTSLAGSTCSSSKPPSQSTLANNFVPAMANLSSLVDENQFGTVVVGSGPSAVFALCQCFKDLNSTECTLCYSEVRSVLPKCYPRSGGRIFLDGCFGRYENFSFFSEGIDSLGWNNCSFGRNSSQPDLFTSGVRNVIRRVSSDAQNNNGFAVATYSASGLTVYALAQCWESLNRSTCNSCIQSAASSITSCSPALQGRSLLAGCYMRYSTGLFWNANNIPQSSGKNNYLWIVLVAIIGVFLALTAIWLLKSYCKPKSDPWADHHRFKLPVNISSSKLNFKYQELRKCTRNFDMSNKLGQGSYGSVYKGVLNGREVAVKRLFMNTRQWSDKFFNEVDLISQVHHKNLVKLLGCSLDGPESLLVYEYYFNKSLDLFIFDDDKAKLLDWPRRFDIIQGVAEGLCYLHEESAVRIIHRDIKASNILLDDKFKPKITDFGLARSFAIDQTHLNTGVAGTLGYMAPEYVVHGHLTEKADVYSFGILALEIITRKRCTDTFGAEHGEGFVARIWSEYKVNKLLNIIDEFIYEDAIKHELHCAVHVGLLCIQGTPGFRPSMSKVVEVLRSGIQLEDLYPPTGPPFLHISMIETAKGEGSSLLTEEQKLVQDRLEV